MVQMRSIKLFPAAIWPRATLPLPIRLDFWHGETLHRVSADLAADAAPELLGFAPFNYQARLEDNMRAVRSAYLRLLDQAGQSVSGQTATVTPAAEWLLDNHHIVDENFRHLRRDLSIKVYRALPSVTLAEGTEVPRTLALVWNYVAVANSDLSLQSLTEAVEGFQSVKVLTIGEIWAVPAVLRFVLLENLRRLADRIDWSRKKRAAANVLADQLAAAPASATALLATFGQDCLDDAFAAQLLYRLRDGSEQADMPLRWLEDLIAKARTTADRVIATEHALQSSGNVTVGNIIRSLRMVDEIDWLQWFEGVSRVDATLRSCPDYGQLDKYTRNSYRDTIERIARRSDKAEVDVAIVVAQGAAAGRDPGVALVGQGLRDLERLCGYRQTVRELLVRRYQALGWIGIAAPSVVLTAVIATVMAQALVGLSPGLTLVLFGLALLPASEAAVGLVNFAGARAIAPRRLPAYDYTNAIPETARTLVVIPCILSSLDDVDDLLRNLELHYLSNPRGAVAFALLSDWIDNVGEERSDDAALLKHAQEGIEALAATYASSGERRFFLLHRRRIYNPGEGVWMGWERKRGKLVELNHLLRGDTDTSFIDTGLRPTGVNHFVVTLDSDTRLPRDSVAMLVGKMAHPVNRAVIDPATQTVIQGYAIMQPRVTASLTTGDEASVFQRVFSTNRGLDPYVFTVSDLYQDLLGQGSFTGKGIYDLDAFSVATDGVIPDNTVLSHDLFEGSLAHTALVTDVQFVEDFPVKYHVDASRQHRWARGDWQLLPFIWGHVRGLGGLGRLKMVDNLRRSLVPVALVAAILFGWLLLDRPDALRWQILLMMTMLVASMLSFLTGLRPGDPSVLWTNHLRVLANEMLGHVAGFLLRLSFIADHAALTLDAVLRTIYRMAISHKHLLEWRTASQVAASGSGTLKHYLRGMIASPLLAVGCLAMVMLINPSALPVAAPIAIMWLVAPFVAWRISQTQETEDRLDIRPADALALRQTARITWRFFEEFVTAASHHLPPDNFQDMPEPKIAERTSPTNIGLYLLAVLSARDFGWISLRDTLDRLDQTLSTVESLPKHRGHVFNWYDTRDLSILQPHYVSSVDSGNLAGHLITLAAALKRWARNSIIHLPADACGIGDVLRVLRQQLATIPDDRRNLRPLRRRVEERILGFEEIYTVYVREPQLAPVRGINLTIIARDIQKLARSLLAETGTGVAADLVWWAGALQATCEAAITDAAESREATAKVQVRLNALAERARSLAFAMDFGFLMNPEKRLLSIGYRKDSDELDPSCYDLLASEARLASFFGIAKGDLPNEHWFRLGRPVATVRSTGALMSWSGSMFEYLMPLLIMKERVGGILHQSNAAAVIAQIDHGARTGAPWGVSESAFNIRDREMNYQYHAFGVPALALKRGSADERVIAPYATALASQIRPRDAVLNLRRLADMGGLGRHGYFDAIDLTPSRLPEGAKHAVVRTVMAHHQGMVIVAVANAVMEGIHRDRFHDDPVVQAAELLLQEKAPREIVPITRPAEPAGRVAMVSDPNAVAQTVIDDPQMAPRAISILSNGRYSKMVTATGAGYSRLLDRAVTRWKPDPSRDTDGLFLFLRDPKTDVWWSATTAPKAAPEEVAHAIFSDHKAEFLKTVGSIETHLETIVGSEADAEGHRLTIRNRGSRSRSIEVTSYGEIVLDTDAADRAHPAFSKMFVETRIDPNGTTITARRNRRAAHERPLHLAHLICGTVEARALQAETDRRVFIGRGRNIGNAAAFDPGAGLNGTQGFTMDPIFALRRTVRIAPGKEVSLTFWTVVADDAGLLDTAIAHYRNPATYDHESRLAWTQSQIQLRQMNSSIEEVAVFRDMARYLIYPDPQLSIQDNEIRTSVRPQSALWAMGISGDYPIVLIRIDSDSDLPILRTALRMMEYFRHHGVNADLVIVNERASSYTQDLQNALITLCESAARMAPHEARRCAFVLRRDQMAPETLRAMLAVARIVLHAQNGTFSDQLKRIATSPAKASDAAPLAGRALLLLPSGARTGGRDRQEFPDEPLDFWNGYGGFATDGKTYVVRLRHGEATPHPWINVIGRNDFGFHVSAEGAGYTWAANSRDYQVTPWSNDPVENRVGEAIFVRNARTGRVATPFAALSDDAGAIFEARHGLGQSQFRSWTDWVSIDAVQTLSPTQPGKLTRVRITNRGDETISVDCVAYAELVLGSNRAISAPMIRARFDAGLNAVIAHNPFNTEYSGRMVALGCDRQVRGHVASRRAFLGGLASLEAAARCMRSWPQTSAALETDGDPCAALRTVLDIAPGATEELTFVLADTGAADMPALLADCLHLGGAAQALVASQADWASFLETLQVKTPDRKFDLMVNTWLPYQTLSCRIRARSAFYQASGAYGFRDQLQDTSALILHDPSLARRQIVNAAGRQFAEGDVQHWWLPATGAGVRTSISDDVVWLAHSAARYVRLTGDEAILEEPIAYLVGTVLQADQHDAFFTPDIAPLAEPLYDHCARALNLAIARTGPNGLPLMLGGDWNDGMNRVGEAGRGESIWLGWFLCLALDEFSPLAVARGNALQAAKWRAHRKKLGRALDLAGWDGGWYRRAYFDDGTPLGSQQNDECRIDSIAQSWAAISRAGQPDRMMMAIDAALAQLQDNDAGVMRLFTPPFEKTPQEPGYIKGYPPGVRENGGQYTHAAAWMVYALAQTGRGNDAYRLFDLINPISHALTRADADRYRVEPYVVAADVYGDGDKTGRGGWTWYTGSSGWLYRAAVEGILGILPDGGTHLRITPALPSDWPGYDAVLRLNGRVHRINVTRDGARPKILLDGRMAGPDGRFALHAPRHTP